MKNLSTRTKRSSARCDARKLEEPVRLHAETGFVVTWGPGSSPRGEPVRLHVGNRFVSTWRTGSSSHVLPESQRCRRARLGARELHPLRSAKLAARGLARANSIDCALLGRTPAARGAGARGGLPEGGKTRTEHDRRSHEPPAPPERPPSRRRPHVTTTGRAAGRLRCAAAAEAPASPRPRRR